MRIDNGIHCFLLPMTKRILAFGPFLAHGLEHVFIQGWSLTDHDILEGAGKKRQVQGMTMNMARQGQASGIGRTLQGDTATGQNRDNTQLSTWGTQIMQAKKMQGLDHFWKAFHAMIIG